MRSAQRNIQIGKQSITICVTIDDKKEMPVKIIWPHLVAQFSSLRQASVEFIGSGILASCDKKICNAVHACLAELGDI